MKGNGEEMLKFMLNNLCTATAPKNEALKPIVKAKAILITGHGGP
jgi:hypothetical protein